MIVDFFKSRFDEKARLIKNHEKRIQPLLGPELTFTGQPESNAGASRMEGREYTKSLVDAQFNECSII